MDAILSAKKLGKIYIEDYAVKDVSFDVTEGEIFGFLGPNGAGKTTTLRMICGILDPTEGKCKVKGYDVVDDKIKVKETIGYLPEEDFLYGDLTVKTHLEYIGELYGVENIDAAVISTLSKVDMLDKIDLQIKTLSKGQRRRVAIAKTLIHNPQIVLLDEVTSGLDPVYARKMVDLVRELRDEGKTVVFSTHLLDEATKLCDRILIIAKGRVQALGTIDDVIKQSGTTNLEEAFFKLIEETED